MRNPFRRQTETAAPSLHERAASLREGLSRQAAPAERADLYDRLMTLYEEDRLARPISGRESGTVAKRAADLVTNRLWDLAREIVAMPPPKTMEGLRLTALASLVLCEADYDAEDPAKVAATGLTRAALAITNTPFPAGFVGFGDEADHFERDRALFAPAGSVPAWAVAEIEAESASFPPAPTDLADACLWAVRHRAWIDGELKASDWSDERFDGESAKTNAVFTRAINEPSANLREITAKAALALEDFERFILLPGRKLDDGTRIVHTVLREIVGVGREAGASVALTSSSDLTAAILDGWASWGATQDRLRGEGTDAEVEAALAPMNRLVGAVADLPATTENIAAKALAAAWSEWVFSERHEAPRSAYPTGERCLFDIHAAITARGSKETDWHCSPVDLIAAAGLSIEALPVSDLCSIFDAAMTLSDVASALTCQPRQMAKEGFNGAGRLTESTGFALHRVIEAVANELRRRTPANASEREQRAAILARRTIDNDDPAEIAAFARELLAMVEP